MLPLPATFFVREPVVFILGMYLVLLYVLLFTFLSGFEYVFQRTYQLSTGQTGSCFAAIAAGETLSVLIAPALYGCTRRETNYARRASTELEPRLWPTIAAAPLLPASLFWLGWGAHAKVSIWSGLVACFVFGIALIAVYISSYEYIIDSYGEHAAVALASITWCDTSSPAGWSWRLAGYMRASGFSGR